MTEDQIGTIVIEAAIAVHRALGPGLLETVYEVVLARELADRGLKVDRQVPVAFARQRWGAWYCGGYDV
ncbi:MAG: GxxExxY protein [Lentisphaerae bacterium]|nr:GxxExxY protein [Lentisphaerota bacterium]